MKLFRTLLTAFTLLSRIPVPVAFEPRYRAFLAALPAVGIPAGAAASLLLLAGTALNLPSFVTAGLILFATYAGFNLFHFDGLLDSADAFFLAAGPEKRHAILKDSSVGSFALFAGVLYLFLKFSALLFLADRSAGMDASLLLIVGFYPVAGRLAAAMIPLGLGPARREGLGALMGRARRGWAGAALPLYLIPAAALLLQYESPYLTPFAVAVCIALAGAWGWSVLLYRRIGGYTGDAFGLAVELGELFYLLTICVLL